MKIGTYLGYFVTLIGFGYLVRLWGLTTGTSGWILIIIFLIIIALSLINYLFGVGTDLVKTHFAKKKFVPEMEQTLQNIQLMSQKETERRRLEELNYRRQ